MSQGGIYISTCILVNKVKHVIYLKRNKIQQQKKKFFFFKIIETEI